jgi:hypothetical protein
MDGLEIPLEKLLEIPHVTVEALADGVVEINGLSEGTVTGNLHQDTGRIAITDFAYYGEFSGSNSPRLRELLKHSKGTLIAVLVWEGGDSITKLTARDGVVSDVEIEL